MHRSYAVLMHMRASTSLVSYTYASIVGCWLNRKLHRHGVAVRHSHAAHRRAISEQEGTEATEEEEILRITDMRHGMSKRERDPSVSSVPSCAKRLTAASRCVGARCGRGRGRRISGNANETGARRVQGQL